ncbi:hypothetical protein EW146_g2759 [Bondarzewia mesenterica]|uniref:DUF6699 domain-containing protein n=1 Tax=Bondarzewia mesenterica TaxID=1095465 RepID=A0A4S4M1Y4_9AGAM|nr:hypothetical protein EW146_g2759 [Bondarzewia mesenterica]
MSVYPPVLPSEPPSSPGTTFVQTPRYPAAPSISSNYGRCGNCGNMCVCRTPHYQPHSAPPWRTTIPNIVHAPPPLPPQRRPSPLRPRPPPPLPPRPHASPFPPAPQPANAAPPWITPGPSWNIQVPAAGTLSWTPQTWPPPIWTPQASQFRANTEWPPTQRNLPIHVAPWLTSHSREPPWSLIDWDLSQQPETAKRTTSRGTLEELTKHFWKPAVHPAAFKIVIICNYDLGETGRDWRPIAIEKNRAITCGDVFHAIFYFLQEPLPSTEVDYICSLDPNNWQKMWDSCNRRCWRTPGLAEFERRQGLKRVDCLGVEAKFAGLSVVLGADETWTLRLRFNSQR